MSVMEGSRILISHTTMLVVTHNNSIKNMMDHIVIMKDGMIVKNYINDNKIEAAMLEDL